MSWHARFAILLAVALSGVILATLSVPVGADDSSTDLIGTRTPRGSRRATPWPTPGCLVTATHHADPAVLRPGDLTTTTVHVGVRCTEEVYPLHVVLVLDQTSALDRRTQPLVLTAARNLAQGILAQSNSYDQVGVVGYSDLVRSTCGLTSDADALGRCIRGLDRLRRGGGGRLRTTPLAGGIQEAMSLLRRGRQLPPSWDTREIMIIFTNGAADGDCREALRAVDKVKGQTVLVASVCLDSQCDAACVRQLASSNRYFFQINDAGALLQMFYRISDCRLLISLKRLTLFYQPASELRYEPASAEPEPDEIDADGRLSWVMDYVPLDGVTVTLQLATSVPGRWSLAQEAGGTWVDNGNRPGTFVVPAVEVEVVAP